MRRRCGFTLIELLVVIAILALLFGILMPVLRIAREQGRRSVCGQNEKNMALGLIMYGNDYDGKLPQNQVDRWLFDVSYWTTDILMRSGAFDRHTFYCPSYPGRDRIIFWRYGENLPGGTTEGYPKPEPTDDARRKDYHRIIGYFWLIDYLDGRREKPMTPEGGQSKDWVRSLIDTKAPPAMVEMIVDSTCSTSGDRQNADFTAATGGVMQRWGLYDRTNHIKGTKCTGTNVAFVDGHVEWRHFNDMECRWPFQTYANPSFWW